MRIMWRWLFAYIGRALERGDQAYCLVVLGLPIKPARSGFEWGCRAGFELAWWFDPEPYWVHAPHLSIRWTGREPGQWQFRFRLRSA